MIKNGGNLCYKLDFAAATSCRDTQASSKAGIRARVGSAYIVGGWRTVSLFNASSAAFACKGPQARKPLQWCKQDTF